MCVLYDFGMGVLQRVGENHITRMQFWVWGRKKERNEILKPPSVPDSFMDGYVIGMTAHSLPIKGQHLKQQNILLCQWKARIQEEKKNTN